MWMASPSAGSGSGGGQRWEGTSCPHGRHGQAPKTENYHVAAEIKVVSTLIRRPNRSESVHWTKGHIADKGMFHLFESQSRISHILLSLATNQKQDL
jgi:hypothetical protein